MSHLKTAHEYGVRKALAAYGYGSVDEFEKEAVTLATLPIPGALVGALAGAYSGGEGHRASGAALGAAGGALGGLTGGTAAGLASLTRARRSLVAHPLRAGLGPLVGGTVAGGVLGGGLAGRIVHEDEDEGLMAALRERFG